MLVEFETLKNMAIEAILETIIDQTYTNIYIYIFDHFMKS